MTKQHLHMTSSYMRKQLNASFYERRNNEGRKLCCLAKQVFDVSSKETFKEFLKETSKE